MGGQRAISGAKIYLMTRSIMGTGVLTMNIGLPIGLGLVIGLAPVAVADNLTTMFSLAGKCLAVTAMDAVTDPSLCINKLVSIETTNGRLGFAFTLTRKGDSKPVVISFFGDGAKELHLDKDTAMQPIDRVHFT